jgi:tetratricopeptide (TPR) repeat protein
MVSYLLIFAASFYILWKNFLKKKTDFWSTGIFTSLFIAYFVQNLTVFDMVSSYLMFFLSLAFIASLEKKENLQEAKITNLNPLIFSLIFIIFIFSFTFFVIQPTINDVNVISAIKPPPFSKEQLSLFKRTLSLSPLGKFQIRQFFVEQTLNNLYSAQLPNKNTKEEIEFLIQEMRKTIKESPLDYRSYLRLGQLLNFYSQIESNKILEAEEILKKAIEISPTNQQGYWQLSQNMLFQRKFEEALNLVEKAVKLEPKLLQSHLIVIQVAKIIGDNELVEKKIKEAIEIDPSWESEIKKILKDS